MRTKAADIANRLDASENGQAPVTAKPAPARWPRVLDVNAAAEYLGVSPWTVGAWAAAGLLPVVEFPATPPREGERARQRLRRLLFDLRNLDAHVDKHRRG